MNNILVAVKMFSIKKTWKTRSSPYDSVWIYCAVGKIMLSKTCRTQSFRNFYLPNVSVTELSESLYL